MVKNNKALKKITSFISWLVGSWVGVVIHTVWFAVWLYFSFSLELLTLAVSLEAIFIGIFLLMASNEAEYDRHRQDARDRQKQHQTLTADVELDKEQLVLIQKLTKDMAQIKSRLEELPTKL